LNGSRPLAVLRQRHARSGRSARCSGVAAGRGGALHKIAWIGDPPAAGRAYLLVRSNCQQELFLKTTTRILSTLAVAGSLALASTASLARDIVETAASNDQFSTLVTAVQAAGLVETLKGDGPFTVFAPTNEAFAKLPAGTVENLLKPENKAQLVAVLTYHVVPGKVMSADLAGKKTMATTVQGSAVDIDATSGVKVDNATVVAADIEADNGVIHVIDTVILPN
jgi:uncharacterized surface protein with fasciclin (FAS1) repeats